jgi:hypothetical protein
MFFVQGHIRITSSKFESGALGFSSEVLLEHLLGLGLYLNKAFEVVACSAREKNRLYSIDLSTGLPGLWVARKYLGPECAQGTTPSWGDSSMKKGRLLRYQSKSIFATVKDCLDKKYFLR